MTRAHLNTSLIALVLYILSSVITAPVCAQPAAAAKPTNDSVEQLIKQLSSYDEAKRTAAIARLERMPEAIPALRKAADSSDYVLQLRAEAVLREALMYKNRPMVEGYPVDVFLERLLIVKDSYEEESYWRVAAELVGKILDRENRETKLNRWAHPSMAKMPIYDFLKYQDQFKRFNSALPSIVVKLDQPVPVDRGTCVLRRESIDLPEGTALGYSLLASPGPIRARILRFSVVLGGSTVTIGDAPGVIIAAGDVHVDKIAGLIIARGSVTSRRDFGKSYVLAGGKVESEVQPDSIVRQNIPGLLGWVRFFEVSDAGLEVAAADGGVKVVKVADKQPPQKAGLRAGDVITKIDGTDVKDVEQFRRVLRHGTVQEAVRFTVRRDGKPLELTASFVGWEPPPLNP